MSSSKVLKKNEKSKKTLQTELGEYPHLRTVYHMFVAIFSILFMKTLFQYYADHSKINIGWRLIGIGFSKIQSVGYLWLGLQSTALLAHPLLGIWNCGVKHLSFSAFITKVWNYIWILFFVFSQLLILTATIYFQRKWTLPVASSFLILIEMVRMVMKMYAYIRTVSSQSYRGPWPSLISYLYFLFAPTFLYKNTYPRTKEINWNEIVCKLIEVFLCIVFLSYLCECFIINYYQNIGKPNELLKLRVLIYIYLFDGMMASFLAIVCFSYLLHTWLNIFSRLLRFAEHQFYLDWWNACSFGSLFQRWSTILYEWFDTFVYTDLTIITGSTTFASTVVVVLSVVMYEMIISAALGIFMPVMPVVMAFLGGPLSLFGDQYSNKGNILMWTCLIIMAGTLWTVYSLEYFVRINCPIPEEGWMVPRVWLCPTIKYQPQH